MPVDGTSSWVPTWDQISTSRNVVKVEEAKGIDADDHSLAPKQIHHPIPRDPSNSPSPLCTICFRIFDGRRPDSPLGGPHEHRLGQTLADQEKSAVTGLCVLCCILRAQISPRELSKLDPDAEITYGYWESNVGNGMAFQYTPLNPSERHMMKSVGCFDESIERQPNTSNTPWSILTPLARLQAGQTTHSTNSFSTFATIDRWLGTCIAKHDRCSTRLRQSTQLPTRVIDLGWEDEIRPVLRRSSDLKPAPYVTLSHCWGKKEFLQLKQDNMGLLQRGIPVAELSATSRHAMEVAWRLDVRYVWIDSLCIIQDSPEDWEREATRMADVYSNSLLTIAATSSKDGGEGLFRQSRLIDFVRCRVKPRWTSNTSATSTCYRIGEWEDEVNEQLLLARAWVVQEQTLSARIVHFTNKQVFWECEESRASESFPDKLPNTGATKPTTLPNMNVPEGFWDLRSPDYPWHNVCHDAVQQYSRADLTFRTKDKLIAISGIARRLSLPPESYLAGLWKEGLQVQLLWTVKRFDAEPHRAAKRAAEYRAPSWSWASIDGEVIMRHVRTDSIQRTPIQFLEAFVEPLDSSNPFGRVKSGYIRLLGVLAAGYLQKRTVMQTTTAVFRNGTMVDVPLAPNASYSQDEWYLGSAHVRLILDEGSQEAGRVYHCLLFDSQGGFGLLIGPVSGERGTYRRLGYFAVLSGKQSASVDSFLQLCTEFAAFTNHDESLYEEKSQVTGTGLQVYMIKLI